LPDASYPGFGTENRANGTGGGNMISKGDLVKMRMVLGGDSQSGGIKEIFILGRMINYCDEEDSYIVDPKVLSVRKDQVAEINRLLEDFDFENASEELSSGGFVKKKYTIAPDIVNIRISDKN
jgi:hypothetical protein